MDAERVLLLQVRADRASYGCGNTIDVGCQSKGVRTGRSDPDSHVEVFESPGHTSEQFQRLMADRGVVCSMSRSRNVWDNAAMESFFLSLKTERTARRVYRSRDEARADVFDYIERFYNRAYPSFYVVEEKRLC
jgi:hypothetical protein